MVCYHYLVVGHVQGVGYRQFTLGMAKEIGLIGWVRNLRDGRVEILAQGHEDSHHEFKQKLLRGPPRARVSELQQTKVDYDMTEFIFSVTADGDRPWRIEA